MKTKVLTESRIKPTTIFPHLFHYLCHGCQIGYSVWHFIGHLYFCGNFYPTEIDCLPKQIFRCKIINRYLIFSFNKLRVDSVQWSVFWTAILRQVNPQSSCRSKENFTGYADSYPLHQGLWKGKPCWRLPKKGRSGACAQKASLDLATWRYKVVAADRVMFSGANRCKKFLGLNSRYFIAYLLCFCSNH